MGLILWIILGALAGWIASVMMRTNAKQGFLEDLFFGIAGAVVGGLIFGLFGQPGIMGFNIYSLVVAVLGSAALIYIGRLMRHT
ncbi:MAG: GlsB/YeaQ/YmgE family stress response membrane protein [Candidatus Levybacteria bacterium]|nr:GlsB/YeaQ/YmgE family stress response membrane protein [Candidatus Levybacteria bacterium]